MFIIIEKFVSFSWNLNKTILLSKCSTGININLNLSSKDRNSDLSILQQQLLEFGR